MVECLTVAYQGILGSFSSAAAEALCGPSITPLHTQHFREIFEYLLDGSARIGVVPIENALAGTVQENYDLLDEFPIRIVAEHYLPVQLDLIGLNSTSAVHTALCISGLSEVVSHPKALEQCSRFFELHRHIKQVIFSDTAGAVKYIKERQDPSVAAIGSAWAASLLGLHVIAPAIQNHTTNVTRFVAVALPSAEGSSLLLPPPSGLHSKCSLAIKLCHVPGALHRVLGVLFAAGLNLTKIESRPLSGSPFEYRFYLDVTGATSPELLESEVRTVLEACTEELRVLGAYLSKSELAG